MSGCDMDIVGWMEECYEEEIESMDPESVYVKQRQISVQLSTTVKRTKKGSRSIEDDSIKEGYKRIISGTKILVEKKPHYRKVSWNPPRAKELSVSCDGENWSEPISKEYTELRGLYVKYKGTTGDWYRFIENGELVKHNKIEYSFVDAIDTRQTH
jgi:hypothetical protein